MTKQSLYQGTIFTNYLLNLEFLSSQRGQSILNEHMLLGWLASEDKFRDSPIFPIAKSEFKRQWHLNQVYSDLIKELAPDFEKAKMSPVLLKGITFLEDIYEEVGNRSMSDLDILIKKEELSETIRILSRKGFQLISDKKWSANKHKVVLNRVVNDIEMVVELHTSLLYHVASPDWKTSPFRHSPYLTLANEELILFQCTHLAFQHTFLKLFWLIDIHLLLNKIKDLDEKRVLEFAQENAIYNSLILTLFVLQKYFKTPMGDPFSKAIEKFPRWKKNLLDTNFLLDPKKNYFKYQIVKHICKDSLKESFKYDLNWIKNRFL